MIPASLHRVVPERTTEEAERFWHRAKALMPDWDFHTWRDPLNPVDWPLTRDHWHRCKAGAQFAGLIRLEVLIRYGGVYIDQDVEPYRSFAPLLHNRMFCAWEDTKWIPDAVLGAEANHPALKAILEIAINRLDEGPSESGPQAVTAVVVGRDDVLVLPPGSFFPYHYTEKHRRHDDHMAEQPWSFACHHWNGSWL